MAAGTSAEAYPQEAATGSSSGAQPRAGSGGGRQGNVPVLRRTTRAMPALLREGVQAEVAAGTSAAALAPGAVRSSSGNAQPRAGGSSGPPVKVLVLKISNAVVAFDEAFCARAAACLAHVLDAG